MIFRGTDSWTTEAKIGRGGQAEVYRVYREGDVTRQPFALKRLVHPVVSSPDRPDEIRTQRFRIEVASLRVLNDLGCPGIVRVIDEGLSIEGGDPWFVMPMFAAGAMWKRGRSPEYLESYRGNLDRVLTIALAIAETLTFVHGRGGWVHRDVKCGNIFFDAMGGPPTLGDFGLVYSPESEPVLDTAVTDRMGPSQWRPPEFRRGGLDRRNSGSDVYLLGGVIYEALTGGEHIDETEHVGKCFVHELPEFSVARFVNDERVPFVNAMLRGMFRRDPDLRISAANVAELCRAIVAWRAGESLPSAEAKISEAEEAAAEYRLRSAAIRDETVRQELDRACESVAAHFGERGWAKVNQLTKMIDKNWGDTEPLASLKSRYPESVWMAVRIIVAFETYHSRPMFMSYVFIGRTAPNREIVGVFNEEREWTVLSEGPPNHPQNVRLMVAIASTERDRLLKKLAPLIRDLR